MTAEAPTEESPERAVEARRSNSPPTNNNVATPKMTTMLIEGLVAAFCATDAALRACVPLPEGFANEAPPAVLVAARGALNWVRWRSPLICLGAGLAGLTFCTCLSFCPFCASAITTVALADTEGGGAGCGAATGVRACSDGTNSADAGLAGRATGGRA